ncbi:dual specificity protein phosphatase 22-A [Brachionichthys hirsutus]|uniref:dual specificity protein phosphatase 22-A n=1 Tax=Brachionichthys hirsutus TaxID=412623 RepID=UPI0036051249
MGNHMNKVVDGLYIGSFHDAESKEGLKENGITHVLSVHHDAAPLHEDMTYLCIQAHDDYSQDLLPHFKNAIGFIHECRTSGGVCLVHCLAGVSRSTTLVVAYLMTATDYGFSDCLNAVKVARSCVCPNYGFQNQLKKFEATQVSEYRAWLRSSFLPSPFNDQELVGALLMQRSEIRGSEELGRPVKTRISDLPSGPDDPASSS